MSRAGHDFARVGSAARHIGSDETAIIDGSGSARMVGRRITKMVGRRITKYANLPFFLRQYNSIYNGVLRTGILVAQRICPEPVMLQSHESLRPKQLSNFQPLPTIHRE